MLNYRESLLLLVTTPLYSIVIVAEILLSYRTNRPVYSAKGILQNVYLSVLNASLDLLTRAGYMMILTWFFHYRVITVSHPVLHWVLLLLLEDFAFYWLHRVDHACNVFWAVHVTHHSSKEFNLTTGFRSSVFQPLYRFIYFIPIAWLGFPAEEIVFMYSATQIWGILIHTQYVGKLGILEWFMVTPSHHRVHHASNIRYLDRNMGMCLIIWDRLFGTFAEERPEDPVRYGLTTDVVDTSPVNLIFHEWKKLLENIRKPGAVTQKIQYLFAPPGWSHDGSSLTANQLRQTLPVAQGSLNHPFDTEKHLIPDSSDAGLLE